MPRRHVVNSLYRVQVRHARAEPLRHAVRQRGYLWFVDLDDLPRLPRALRPLARFDSADHLGRADRSIRDNIDAFLAGHGVDLAGGRVTMLTYARSLGYVFNPLTLFWCHDRSGAVVCVLAEVRNTYGESHCYLIRVDAAGRGWVPKQFYVSPFYPVDGYYRMSVPEPAQRLAITVSLHRPGQRPFVATIRGKRTPASPGALLAATLLFPLNTLRVRAGIVRHGVSLYLKGLPVVPRRSAG